MNDPKLNTKRMFAAADALLSVVSSAAGKNGVIEIVIDDTQDAAISLGESVFTQQEVLAAMDFLSRAGFMDDPVR